MPLSPKLREAFKSEKDLSEECYFEFEVSTGIITWFNESLKSKIEKYELDLNNSSVYTIVSEDYRPHLSNFIDSIKYIDNRIKTVWPIPCKNGKISWLTTDIELNDKDYFFIKVEFLEVDNDPLMSVISLNLYQTACITYDMHTLKKEIRSLKNSIVKDAESSKEDLDSALNIIKKAEIISIQNRDALRDLKNQVQEQFSKHTNEITRLMTSDVIHDTRMAIFESHVKKTTTEALTQIIVQAEESGKGLTKKLTLPVGVMGGVIALVQWIFTYYMNHR